MGPFGETTESECRVGPPRGRPLETHNGHDSRSGVRGQRGVCGVRKEGGDWRVSSLSVRVTCSTDFSFLVSGGSPSHDAGGDRTPWGEGRSGSPRRTTRPEKSTCFSSSVPHPPDGPDSPTPPSPLDLRRGPSVRVPAHGSKRTPPSPSLGSRRSCFRLRLERNSASLPPPCGEGPYLSPWDLPSEPSRSLPSTVLDFPTSPETHPVESRRSWESPYPGGLHDVYWGRLDPCTPTSLQSPLGDPLP